jgi:glycosyltransferase involved in cell wall biosynthesis
VPDRLRVLLVSDAVGGVWDSCLALAEALCRSGDATVLLAVVGPPPTEAQAAAARSIPRLQLRALRGRLEWMDGGREWLERHRLSVARLAAEWGADLAHVNQLGPAAFAGRDGPNLCRIPVLLGVHSDLVTWWSWVKDGGRGPRTLPHYLRWQYDLAWDAVRQADAVVCPSHFLAGQVAALYGLGRLPHVVHNAVEVPPDTGSQAAVGHAVHRAVVVAGRAWDEAKNVDLVAAALPLCRREWGVEVAGEMVEPGHPRPPLPCPPGLTYTGFLTKPELAARLRRAALCIAPASYDPFGLGPAEAALAGCAVLANDIPSYREVWGPAALYFERNDPRSLAGMLDRLADEPATVAGYARLAQRRVRERYTRQRMAAGYLALYRALLTRRADHAEREVAACASPFSITPSVPIGTMATPTS